MKNGRSYYIPDNALSQSYDHIKAVVYCCDKDNKFLAMGFSGKRSKPDFYYSFSSQQNQENYIKRWVNVLERYQEKKNELKRVQKEFYHTLKVGEILYSSWGYDQTNIDYYEVVEVKSKKSVVIQKIACSISDNGSMSGSALPKKGAYCGDKMLKRVSVGNTVRVENGYTASRWDGEPKYCSWYA